MKICLVTRFYPPDTGGGGIAAYARYAAIGLTRAGHEVRVVSAMAKDSKPKQWVDGVGVFRISPPFDSYYWTRLPLLGRYVRFVRDLMYAWQVRQTLLKMSEETPPDIVEYADIDAEGLFHPRSLAAFVVKLHASHAVLKPYYKYKNKQIAYEQRSIEWIERRTIYSANGLSSPSQFLGATVASLMQIDGHRIQHVPNFIDIQYFSPPNVETKGQSLLVLYVGRLESLKGAPVFAQAAILISRVIPKARFILAGMDRTTEDGQSQKSVLEQMFAQANIQDRVQFFGHDSMENFLAFYRECTVFVIPSLFESFGYTLLEAMSCGRACVVSRAGGLQEMIINGESGLFFEPGDPRDLAEKVIALLSDPRRRKSMGLAARQRVEQEYSLEVGTEKTVSFYKSVLEKE